MTPLAWAWLAVFILLTGLSLHRPAWAVVLYLQTYFALPSASWWGEALASYRWNLIAGVVLAAAVVIDLSRRDREGLRGWLRELERSREQVLVRWILLLLVAMVANAVLVHWLLAPDRAISLPSVVYLVKHVGLALLVFAALRHQGDSRIVLSGITLGTTYLGLSVLVFDQGSMIAGRLERFGPARASESNGLPALILVLLPLCWVLLLRGRPVERLLVAAALPLSLWLVVLCKSRSAALAAVTTGLAMLVLAPKDLRRAWGSFCLVALVLASLMAIPITPARIFSRPAAIDGPDSAPQASAMPRQPGTEPTVIDRPETDAREAPVAPPPEPSSTVIDRLSAIPRELTIPGSSSSSRLLYWRVGLRVLLERPVGSGGKAFRDVLSPGHLASLGIQGGRSVHNGYLDEAISWGIQGLVLRLAFLGALLLLLRRIAFDKGLGRERRFARAEATGLAAGLMAMLAVCVFLSLLDIEWQYWLAGLALSLASRPIASESGA